MITLKEQLIQEIRYLPREKTIKTIETLDTGEYNEMTFQCSQESLLQIINNLFDDNLHGCVPNGVPTTINGWEAVDKEEQEE